jgi:hypothetical protein
LLLEDNFSISSAFITLFREIELHFKAMYITLQRLQELVQVLLIALLKPVRGDKLWVSIYFRSNLLPSSQSKVRSDSGKEEHNVQEVWGTYFFPIDSTEYHVLGLRFNFVEDV